jgi:hypothetical protein
VVVVAAAALVVSEVGALPVRVVAVVADDAVGAGLTGWAAGTLDDVLATVSTLELVVLIGGPATANSPPRRKEGGPLWVSL